MPRNNDKPPQDLTEDSLLGGRVSLLQPAAGYRAAIDPVFLVTLYVKHDEEGAATRAIAGLYGSASIADRQQLVFRLRHMGQGRLAEDLEVVRVLEELSAKID